MAMVDLPELRNHGAALFSNLGALSPFLRVSVHMLFLLQYLVQDPTLRSGCRVCLVSGLRQFLTLSLFVTTLMVWEIPLRLFMEWRSVGFSRD